MTICDYQGICYRFGFNGQEKDDEVYGEEIAYNFEFRIHDPRIGRFLSVDPKYKGLPAYSTFSYAINNPVSLIDDLGQWPKLPWGGEFRFNLGHAEIVGVDYDYIQYKTQWGPDWLQDHKPRVKYKDFQLHWKAEGYSMPVQDRGGPTIDPEGGIPEWDKSNPNNSHRNSRHRIGSETIVGDFWNGWTAGWNAAAASGTYTFIDDVVSKQSFNKFYVDNEVINKIETYSFNKETNDFELSATTTFLKTDMIRGEGKNQERLYIITTVAESGEVTFKENWAKTSLESNLPTERTKAQKGVSRN